MRFIAMILGLAVSCMALPITACGPTPPAGVGGAGGSGGSAGSPGNMRDVLLVGNSVSGTVSFIDPHTLRNLGSVNVIADFDEVMGLIQADLIRKLGYPVVRRAQLLHHFEPQNGDRFVDDVFVSPDGSTLYVSRSNLGDVAAFDLLRPGHPRKWRSFVSSVKADHAAISPDGARLVVSATGSGRVADVFDARTGARVGSFPTGTFPHQNDYSADGKYIYNSSIGNVGYQAVRYQDNHLVGDRWLVKVDANTLNVVRTWVFEWGIRPNLISADEKIMYTQFSYLNGVVKYDLQAQREIARSDQPLSEFALNTYATYDEYPHHSAHHGLALSLDGKSLCDCGTIDNDVAIINAADMQVQARIPVGILPYWATTSLDGRYCFVSVSGSNEISVIEYATREHVKVVPVGGMPQRSRMGRVPEAVLSSLNASAG
ncbi:MAG TPA: YncE family protein [Polyangiaceae bacterium]